MSVGNIGSTSNNGRIQRSMDTSSPSRRSSAVSWDDGFDPGARKTALAQGPGQVHALAVDPAQAGQQLGEDVQQLPAQLADAAGSAIDQGLDVAGNVVHGLFDFFGQLASAALGSVGGVVRAAAGAVTSGVSFFGGFFKGLFGF